MEFCESRDFLYFSCWVHLGGRAAVRVEVPGSRAISCPASGGRSLCQGDSFARRLCHCHCLRLHLLSLPPILSSGAAPSSLELGHRHPPCAIATASPPPPVVVSVGATFCSPASWISNAVLSSPRVLPCSARVLLWDEREIAYLYPRVALGVFLGQLVLVLASCAVEAARRRDMLVVPAPRLLRPPTRRPAR